VPGAPVALEVVEVSDQCREDEPWAVADRLGMLLDDEDLTGDAGGPQVATRPVY
jgi:hypothetical protein